MLLGEVALVLGLQVAAPLRLELELFPGAFQNLNGLGVTHPSEIGGGHMLQPLKQPLVHKGVEEGHLLRAFLHHIADDILQHSLGVVHIVGQVGKGQLRLDHPELGSVALGVGALRPEGGAEGVHIGEGHAEALHIQLTGNGEVGGLAEEVLRIVHPAVLGLGDIVQVKGGHLKHLSCALGIGGGDDRRVDIDKALILKEAVDGVGGHAAHPEHGGEQVGSGSQVGNGAQKLHAVALLLQGIVRGGGTLHKHVRRLQLKGLLRLRGTDQRPLYDKGSAHVLAHHLVIVFQLLLFHHHLQRGEAASVTEAEEGKALLVADGFCPAAHGDAPAVKGGAVSKNTCNGCTFHSLQLLLFYQSYIII